MSEQDPWALYGRHERTKFLIVLFLVGACNYVDRNVIGVLLQQIKEEFLISDTMLGFLGGASFALFYATLGIPVAWWADRGDRKLVITISVTAWSVMTAVCGLAGTYWQLIVARFGVGAGEAGAIPPAQSLISDYYPPDQRSRAIGIFTASSSVGYVLGLVVGGMLAQAYGWRVTFIVFGIAGLVLAPVAHLTLIEPRRISHHCKPIASEESITTAVLTLLGKPAYRYLLCGIVTYFLMAYGALVFIVSLMIRNHGLSVGRAGVLFGAVSAVGAAVGSVGGGALADRLARSDVTWLPRFAGWGLLACVPLYELALWTPSLFIMICMLLMGTVVLTSAVPPAYAAVHFVCGSARRSLAIALVLFFANLIGLGGGPVITGVLSDAFGGNHGSGTGLRYALMIMTSVLVAAGWAFLKAGQTLAADVEN